MRAMTERKPPGVTWETWIERQVRRGMEEGAFVSEIDERIRHANRLATSGPPSNLVPLDEEATVERWRSTR